MEKEVRRLFRYDSEAVDVKHEIIVDDEKSLSDSGTSQVNLDKWCFDCLISHGFFFVY